MQTKMGFQRLRMPKVKLVFAALLCVHVLSACDESSSKKTHLAMVENEKAFIKGNPQSQDNQPVELSLVRETSDSLEDLINQLPGETLLDNRWSRLYEQELGIKIKYDWTAKGDLYQQKLAAALASGDLPDVVKVSAPQLRLLSNAGLIQDLSQVYEQYASPFTKEILSQEGSGPFDAAAIDGKLMGIPETSASIERAMIIWIRTDWLQQLGLKEPQTMEDLLAVSRAFTDLDPDQNGQKDTYGLAVTKLLWDPVMGLTGFMAGYDAFPNMWIENESGNLVYGGIQPQVKTALQTLQDMYRKGQIDSEFGIKDGVKVGKQIAAGKIGMMYGEQWGAFWAQGSRTHQPKADWKALPIVSVSGELPKVPLKFSTWQFYAVRKDVRHPEAILRLINLHLEKNWGAAAEFETYYNDPLPVWQLSPVAPFPAMKNLEAFRQIDEVRRTGDTSMLKDEAKAIQKRIETYRSGGPDKEIGWGWERTYGASGAFKIIDEYDKNNQLLYEKFTGAPTETMIERQAVLNHLQDEAYIRIILGRPIEEFDQFVQDWNQLGGNQMTAEVNRWFAEKGSEQQ